MSSPLAMQSFRSSRHAAGKRPPWQARYQASLEGQATLGEPLRRQAAQVGPIRLLGRSPGDGQATGKRQLGYRKNQPCTEPLRSFTR